MFSLIHKNADTYAAVHGVRFELKKVRMWLPGGLSVAQRFGMTAPASQLCVRDSTKARDFHIPAGCEVVTSPLAVTSDPDIDCVVELMGGTTTALEAILDGARARDARCRE